MEIILEKIFVLAMRIGCGLPGPVNTGEVIKLSNKTFLWKGGMSNVVVNWSSGGTAMTKSIELAFIYYYGTSWKEQIRIYGLPGDPIDLLRELRTKFKKVYIEYSDTEILHSENKRRLWNEFIVWNRY